MSPRHDISADNERQPPNAPVEVADGIWRLTLELPMRLNHVNAWLLRDEGGWTLVDCGPDTSASRSLWSAAAERLIAGRPINRIVVTHGHLDHLGAAGWVAARFGVPRVSMTRPEWDYATGAKDMGPAGSRFIDFFSRHGLPSQEAIKAYKYRLKSLSLQGDLPPLDPIHDGDTLRIDGDAWTVLIGAGHSPQHIMLFQPRRRILVAGDQVLPAITPAICLLPNMGIEENPLRDFLDSCTRLAELPHDVLVLPGHGNPFSSLHARLSHFATHHQDRLTLLLAASTGRNSAYDLTQTLFPKAIGTSQEWIALAETLAHLRHLEVEESVSAIAEADKIFFCRRQ